MAFSLILNLRLPYCLKSRLIGKFTSKLPKPPFLRARHRTKGMTIDVVAMPSTVRVSGGSSRGLQILDHQPVT
jgi:hypothetical protein